MDESTMLRNLISSVQNIHNEKIKKIKPLTLDKIKRKIVLSSNTVHYMKNHEISVDKVALVILKGTRTESINFNRIVKFRSYRVVYKYEKLKYVILDVFSSVKEKIPKYNKTKYFYMSV